MADKKFRKGDIVSFTLGIRSVEGEVKEDCGPIGVKGRHLYLVEYRPEFHSPSVSQVELPAEELREVKSVGSHG